MNSTKRNGYWLLVLAAGLLLVGLGLQADTAQAQPEGKKEPKEKLVRFELNNQPWHKVFEFLVDHTGLPFVSPYKPPVGSISVTTPKDKLYTTGELIDVVNVGLQKEKYILIRREAALTIIPADDKIDPQLVPRILLS